MAKSREAHRREMELLEARKAGTVAPAVDEDGNAINPHIPQYVSNAPWYLQNDQPTLRHQRNWRSGGVEVVKREHKVGGATACAGFKSRKNIHAASEDDFARPSAKRQRAAPARSVVVEETREEKQNILGAWERKRDQYASYDPSDYVRVAERYEAIEEIRNEEQRKKALDEKLKAAAAAAPSGAGGEGGGGTAADGATAADDAKAADDEATAFGQVERRVRSSGGGATGTVRNLRIREDTAKYLLNLDLDSAYYDPKTRSMREDPTPWKDSSEKTFAGDNFHRGSGDAASFKAFQQHALAAQDAGQGLHLQALPSAAEAIYKQYLNKKSEVVGQRGADIRAAYGDASANAEKPDERLLQGQTEVQREYDRTGRPISGGAAVARSRYKEDVFPNNHTSVWGSFWCQERGWGFACCKQHVKSSWCTRKADEA